jgi:hypothetical protein
MKKILALVFILLSIGVNASLEKAYDYYRATRSNSQNLLKAASELIHSGYYYTSVPLVKEYLVTARKIDSVALDTVLEDLSQKIGIKQFEVLPMKVLSRSKAPTMRYLLAKKLFKRDQYKKALSYLNASIPRDHHIKPFALNLEATLHNFLGNKDNALLAFSECISRSERMMGEGVLKDRQMEINRDFCIVGRARIFFNFKEFKKAESEFLDLRKSSYIWPEILFEEAWNSFYLKNYNRTLGKLVTYKAPIMQFIYKPEVEILNALTYFELCLWDDASKTVDRFYQNYGNSFKLIDRFLNKHKKDYRYYYLLAQSKKEGKRRGDGELNHMLENVVRDPVFLEMYSSFKSAQSELSRINTNSGRYESFLKAQLRNSLLLERNLIGAYVRSSLIDIRNAIKKSVQGMSSIKLEILKQRKMALYKNEKVKYGKRGDIQNLERTSKQYFWDFNGEFWADELGDYVFSLKSRCE